MTNLKRLKRTSKEFGKISAPNDIAVGKREQIKSWIRKEEMKNLCFEYADRKALTKFRLSNHSLMIEKGRHQGIDRNPRFCKYHEGKVEDEIHILIHCNTCENHRNNLFGCKPKFK